MAVFDCSVFYTKQKSEMNTNNFLKKKQSRESLSKASLVSTKR